VSVGCWRLLPSVTEAQTTTRVRVAAGALQANGKSGDEAALSMDGCRRIPMLAMTCSSTTVGLGGGQPSDHPDVNGDGKGDLV